MAIFVTIATNSYIFFEVSIQSCILSIKFGIVKINFSKYIDFITKVYPYISPL